MEQKCTFLKDNTENTKSVLNSPVLVLKTTQVCSRKDTPAVTVEEKCHVAPIEHLSFRERQVGNNIIPIFQMKKLSQRSWGIYKG